MMDNLTFAICVGVGVVFILVLIVVHYKMQDKCVNDESRETMSLNEGDVKEAEIEEKDNETVAGGKDDEK